MDKQVTVILGPLVALLRSRKVMVSLAALIVTVIVALVPELAPVKAEMIVMIFAVTAAIVGGVAAEDVAKVRADATVKAGEATDVQIRETVTAIMNELLEAKWPTTPPGEPPTTPVL